jgi:hypothetical protein
VRRFIALLRSGEAVIFEDGLTADGVLRRKRVEREADGHVSVFSDHVVTHPDGTEEVVATFRPARFSPDKLVSIEIEEDGESA